MADSSQPDQTPPLATQPSNGSPAPSTNKEKSSLTSAMVSTKYDVLPPRSKSSDTSTQPASSLTAQVEPTPTTPSLPSAIRPVVRNSAQLLASARAKLAAKKEATKSSVPMPSDDARVQIFEITKLKTIKCDICQQRNTDVLYKCQYCNFNHQICSLCVENSDPKGPEGGVAKKNWSVHAKLKDAHAAYKQPICLGKNPDGSYERDDVKFVIAQGKRGGTRKPRKTNPKADVTPADRNAAANRAIGINKTTELGKRIAKAANVIRERSSSADLRARVEAHRAREDWAEEVNAEAQDRKRKADVLDEDEDDEDEDYDEDVKAQEPGDEDRAAALKKLLPLTALSPRDRSNRIKVPRAKKPLWGTFSPRSVRPPRFLNVDSRADVSSGGLKSSASHASITDPSTSQVDRRKGAQAFSGVLPRRVFSTLDRSQRHPIFPKMQITARRSPPIQRSEDHDTESAANESSFSTILEDNMPFRFETRNKTSVLYPYSPTMATANIDRDALQDQRRIQAQRELQYITEEDPNSDPDPHAQDARGISMLLQAARLIEDRERAGFLGEKNQQLDRPAAGESPASSGDDESEDRFKDTSKFDVLVTTARRCRSKRPTTSFRLEGRSLLDDPRNYERRRSGRLASAKPAVEPNLPSTSTTRCSHREQANRSNSKQVKPKPRPEFSTAAAATTAAGPSNANVILRQRIKATEDKAMANSRGKLKRLADWPPAVRGYIREQQAKRKKLTEWQQRQERTLDEEEGYDRDVEGGYWVESEGESEVEGGNEGARDEDRAGRGAGNEGGGDTKAAELEIPDSQDDHEDWHMDVNSDPIVGPVVRRR